jgi:hypothetical protein
MAEQTSSTRALLACGVVGGPLYVLVTLSEALTREGFDLRHHRFSWLTTGDLGWVHQANMIAVGVLTVLFALGVRRIAGTGRGATWGPRLLALLGAAYVVGGLLRADPVVGFPPGTTAEMVHTTWHGAVQNVSRSVSTLFLLAASVVFARRFAAEGRRAAAWFCGTNIPVAFAALTAIGLAAGVNGAGLAFLATPWIWVTALAVPFVRDAGTRGDEKPARPAARRSLATG